MHPQPGKILLSVLLVATLAIAFVPSAEAKAELTIAVKESGCASGAFCFDIKSGSMDDIVPGEDIVITFQNNGGSPHQLDVVLKADMDSAHKATDPEDAFESTNASMAPGTEQTISFTVPADATGVYLFCGVSGHEQLGMWLLADFEAEEESNDSPMLGMAPLLIGLAAVGLVRRRD